MVDRYFEKNRTLRHLAELEGKELSDRGADRRLRIIVSNDILNSETGQILVLTVARLIPRVCDQIDFVAPTKPALKRLRPLLDAPEFSPKVLADLAKKIWAKGSFTTNSNSEVSLTLGIGVAGDVSAGVDDEAAIVIAKGQAPFSRHNTAFSALTAASIAVAQVAKRLYPEIPGEPESYIRINKGPFGANIDHEIRELDRPFIVGVGAVGCALIYALIVAGAKGKILLIDPDKVTDSNLARYVLFDSRHKGKRKVEAAAELIMASGLPLKVEDEALDIVSYLNSNEEERRKMSLLISAVDSYETRREIAGLLPKEILNAGTSPHDFTISRHQMGDDLACLACLYPPQKQDVEDAAIMARELNISKEEVSELKRTKRGLTSDLLKNVALARGKRSNEYLQYRGEPIDSFYNKEFCGETPISTAKGEAIAPLAYGSALAGFWLAQTLLSLSSNDMNRYFRIDFLKGLNTPLRRNRASRVDCTVCGQPAIVGVYKRRWESTPNII